MKNLMLRSGAVLACALSLASCGGGDGNLVLGGQVYNMTKTGLKLANNGGTPIDIAPTGPGGMQRFYFEGLEADDRFNIQVVSQPAGSSCTGRNNVGKMGGYSVDTVVFECFNNPQNLSGQLTGALKYDIVLNNGSDRVTIPAGQTAFSFTRKDDKGQTIGGTVGNGEPFGVTVLDKGQATSCTVQNGSGTMTGDYDLVRVTCQ